jgi:hypothetical protein
MPMQQLDPFEVAAIQMAERNARRLRPVATMDSMIPTSPPEGVGQYAPRSTMGPPALPAAARQVDNPTVDEPPPDWSVNRTADLTMQGPRRSQVSGPRVGKMLPEVQSHTMAIPNRRSGKPSAQQQAPAAARQAPRPDAGGPRSAPMQGREQIGPAQAQYRRDRAAGMRPGTNTEQQFEMFGLDPRGGPSANPEDEARHQQRMAMASRNMELQGQAEANRDAAEATVMLTDEQRSEAARKLRLPPDQAALLQTRADLRKAEMQRRRGDRQKELAVGDMMRRYGPQLMAGGVTEDQLRQSYDDGGLNNHRIRSQAIRDGQGWINHQQQASDRALASDLARGNGPGIVARSFRNARNWEDRLAAASLVNPQLAAQAGVVPDAPDAPPPQNAVDDLRKAIAYARALPPGMRASILAALVPGIDAEAVARGINESEGIRTRSGLSIVADHLMPDALWNWLFSGGQQAAPAQPPQAAPANAGASVNPAGRATGYTDSRSMAMGRNAGRILPQLLG